MPWVNDFPSALVRFIGLEEIAGGLGLVLPAITRILPWLTPLAAAALALSMIFAIVFNASFGDIPNVIFTLVLLVLALYVTYGRWKRVPIVERS